jgi:LuxR family maltose regulon positive regulatory protein
MASPYFIPPRNALSLLHRPELERRLVLGLEGQTVLIEAPAGYGKTEAMATLFEGAAIRGCEAIWITLVPAMTLVDLQAQITTALDLDGNTSDGIIACMGRRSVPLEIYIDEVDRTTDANLLNWLMDQPPDGLRVVIAGRELPNLRLSRLRMRGLLTEIDARHLAFSPGEMRQLLRHWMKPDEMERMIATLCGWPALARLALLECERGASGLKLNALVEGNAPIYRDFLQDEVFTKLNATDWTVLRGLGELDSFTPRIAVELAGLPSDYHTLRMIETMYPLIQPEHQTAGWFCLHPVIAKALDAVSVSEAPERRRARHIHAAELYAESGVLEKSVLHASLGGDVDLAVRTIERAGGVDLFLRAGYTVLRGIVQAVPHATVMATPSLRLCRAVMLAKSGQIREARAVVDQLQRDTDAGSLERDAAWLSTLDHIGSLLEVYEDKPMTADDIAVLRAEVEGERQDKTWRLAWLYNHLAIFYTRLGSLKEAESCAARALSLYQEERSTYPQAFMMIHFGFIDYRANRIEAALERLGQALKLINARHWNDANLLAIAHVPLCAIRYLQGHLDQAREHLERGLPIMAKGEGWVEFYLQGYAALARARYGQDGWTAAQDCLQDGLALADARGLPRLRLSLSILRAELLTRDGRLDAAATTLRQWPDPTDSDTWPTRREWREAQLVIGRLRLRDGEVAEARSILMELADETRIAERWGLLLRVSLLLAEACARLGDIDAALGSLEEAATLSQHGEQVQQYRDEGPEFAEEIRKLVRRSGLARLTRLTAQYLAKAAADSVKTARKGGFLSRREAEILPLLAEGLPNKVIAHRLGVSEPTVKFHLKNLYGKLGVGRRSLAVSVARRSGLLE